MIASRDCNVRGWLCSPVVLRKPPDASKQAKVFGVIAARPSHALSRPWQRRCLSLFKGATQSRSLGQDRLPASPPGYGPFSREKSSPKREAGLRLGYPDPDATKMEGSLFLKRVSATCDKQKYRTTFGVKGTPFCRFHIESSEVRPTWCRISSTGHSIVFRGVPLF